MSTEDVPQDDVVPSPGDEGVVEQVQEGEGGQQGGGGGEIASGGVGLVREPSNAVEAGDGGGVGLVREPVNTVDSNVTIGGRLMEKGWLARG